MSALDKIKKIFRKKKLNVVRLDSEDLVEKDKFQAVLNENAYLKGRELKRIAKEGKERQRDQDKKEEKEKIKDLNKQYGELKEDKEKIMQ